ncbi:hypothetical protein FACS1894132_14120 [Clostridia bacterium]|nr:hypothetical protein FACS1894132_14120 [Clostridia bacterium]
MKKKYYDWIFSLQKDTRSSHIFKTSEVSYVSLTLRYPDKINLYDIIKKNKNALFCFEVKKSINDSGLSLSPITVEFKFSDSLRILKKVPCYFILTNRHVKKTIQIPLSEIEFESAKEISEICFVFSKDQNGDIDSHLRIGNFHIEY